MSVYDSDELDRLLGKPQTPQTPYTSTPNKLIQTPSDSSSTSIPKRDSVKPQAKGFVGSYNLPYDSDYD